MRLDINRVNLAEKDIEDWLFENPRDFPTETENYDETPIVRWIGRQYRLPSGIVDLIGIRENGKVVVVEIKNVIVNKAAILQVCRYASDIEEILGQRESYPIRRADRTCYVSRVVVGPGIDTQTMQEANACDVNFVQFDAYLQVEFSSMDFDDEMYEARASELSKIARQPEWNAFGTHYSDHISPKPISDNLSEDETLDFIFGVQTNSNEEG